MEVNQVNVRRFFSVFNSKGLYSVTVTVRPENWTTLSRLTGSVSQLFEYRRNLIVEMICFIQF